jgi:hypothetical protein
MPVLTFSRGKIAEPIVGTMWRVKHHGCGAMWGLFDIVGGKDEEEATARVRSAYARERVIVSVERMG